MHNTIETILNTLLKNTNDDIAYPFSWLHNNLNFIENNTAYLKEKIDSELPYALLIHYLLLKLDLSQASYHIFIFKRKYPTHPFTSILSALYSIKTNQLELAYTELENLLNKYNSYYLWQLILDCSIKLKWFDNCIYLSKKAQKHFHNDANLLLNLLEYEAYSHHYNFDFEKSINLRKKEINILIKNKNLIQINNSNKTFDTSLAWKSLVDIFRLMEKNHIKAFSTAGTLLGLQRENDILPFDKDIDIAIMPDDDIAMVKIILEKNPRYRFSNNIPAFTSFISVVDTHTGCTIDILNFWKNGDIYEYGWLLPEPYKHESRVLQFTPFQLSRKKFKGINMYVPDKADLFLSELYDNWKVPDQDYFSLLPNNLIKRTKLVDSTSYNQIVSNLRQGNYKKLHIIIERLQELGNNDTILIALKKKFTNNAKSPNT